MRLIQVWRNLSSSHFVISQIILHTCTLLSLLHISGLELSDTSDQQICIARKRELPKLYQNLGNAATILTMPTVVMEHQNLI